MFQLYLLPMKNLTRKGLITRQLLPKLDLDDSITGFCLFAVGPTPAMLQKFYVFHLCYHLQHAICLLGKLMNLGTEPRFIGLCFLKTIFLFVSVQKIKDGSQVRLIISFFNLHNSYMLLNHSYYLHWYVGWWIYVGLTRRSIWKTKNFDGDFKISSNIAVRDSSNF